MRREDLKSPSQSSTGFLFYPLIKEMRVLSILSNVLSVLAVPVVPDIVPEKPQPLPIDYLLTGLASTNEYPVYQVPDPDIVYLPICGSRCSFPKQISHGKPSLFLCHMNTPICTTRLSFMNPFAI